MNLTCECAALDCKGMAVLDFSPFSHVVADPKNAQGEDDKDGARTVFGAEVSLCYPHYRMAVNNERRYFQELDKQERKAKK
jgi:hypothetical protein